MAIPGVQQLLKHYIQQRWCCTTHGYFETGTLIFTRYANCPECKMPAQAEGSVCEGQTTRPLPFVTRPRLELDTEHAVNWQVTRNTGITTRPKSSKASVRRGGQRATGRPKKSPAVPIPTTQERTPVAQQKAVTTGAIAAIAAESPTLSNAAVAAKYGVSVGTVRWHRKKAKQARPTLAAKPEPSTPVRTSATLELEIDHAMADSVWSGFTLEQKLAVVGSAVKSAIHEAVRQHFSAR